MNAHSLLAHWKWAVERSGKLNSIAPSWIERFAALPEGKIHSFDTPWTSHQIPVELVFRTVGERTSEASLALALAAIRPTRVHIIAGVKPFKRAVLEMVHLPHVSKHVVHMDADCLIFEDLRSFVESTDFPYTDCYVQDRFRGALHCGVHVTRLDVVERMRSIEVAKDDLAFVLRPESRLRNWALAEMGLEKNLKSFSILHDYEQWHEEVFAKYALRELRSRTDYQRERLQRAMQNWSNALDFRVAREAIAFAQKRVPLDSSPAEVDSFIAKLPGYAADAVSAMKLPKQEHFTPNDLDNLSREVLSKPAKAFKVFGLGLSRTGTRSLTAGLHALGIHTVHYPVDEASLQTMIRGDGKFPLLDSFDGITDITTIPFFQELDRLHPNAKFIHTSRSLDAWLKSCANHWNGRTPFEPIRDEAHRVHMEIRRFLRASVYGSYEFNAERFSRIYTENERRFQRHFENRPNDYLDIQICAGEGFEKLAPFLMREVPPNAFPHKGKKLSEKMAEKLANLEIDD